VRAPPAGSHRRPRSRPPSRSPHSRLRRSHPRRCRGERSTQDSRRGESYGRPHRRLAPGMVEGRRSRIRQGSVGRARAAWTRPPLPQSPARVSRSPGLWGLLGSPDLWGLLGSPDLLGSPNSPGQGAAVWRIRALRERRSESPRAGPSRAGRPQGSGHRVSRRLSARRPVCRPVGRQRPPQVGPQAAKGRRPVGRARHPKRRGRMPRRRLRRRKRAGPRAEDRTPPRARGRVRPTAGRRWAGLTRPLGEGSGGWRGGPAVRGGHRRTVADGRRPRRSPAARGPRHARGRGRPTHAGA
jgi:hypothetical protein